MRWFWVTGNIGRMKKGVTVEWDVNEMQWIACFERTDDLEHFEWSHVHTRHHRYRVMDNFNSCNIDHVMGLECVVLSVRL